MRAAIYARMSTDKQSADSPADQIARCREFAKARGWTVVPDLVVEEAAISGASRHNRPGLLGLFARISEWDALLVWDFSRLSRDMEDSGWIKNQCKEEGTTAIDVLTVRDVFDLASQMMGASSTPRNGRRSPGTLGAGSWAASSAAAPQAAWRMDTESDRTRRL
jgi:DNA invertase Pin-like site-specific DNA recombinase